MTEVRRHKRTVDGKTVNVRHHTRSGSATAAEKRQDAWEDRAAERWTPPPRGETSETPPADETWWDDDEPRPEAWMDNGDDEADEKTPRQQRREAKEAERARLRAEHERWEADMKADAERRGLPAYRPLGTKASWWKKRN